MAVREVSFENSPLQELADKCLPKQMPFLRRQIARVIERCKDTTYTDANGKEYQGSKFYADALEYVNNKLKVK